MVKKHNKSKISRKRLPKNIKELKDPKTLKVGHITKLSGNKYVVVKKGKNGKKYFKASKKEVKCDKDLKKNIYNMIKEVKSKKKSSPNSYPQALAIAYSKTKKHHPKCELINQDGGLFRIKIFKNIENIQKKIIKTLIRKEYILNEQCQSINPTMTELLKSSNNTHGLNEYKSFLNNIKNRKQVYDISTYLENINNLINRCDDSKNKLIKSKSIKTKYFKLNTDNITGGGDGTEYIPKNPNNLQKQKMQVTNPQKPTLQTTQTTQTTQHALEQHPKIIHSQPHKKNTVTIEFINTHTDNEKNITTKAYFKDLLLLVNQL